MAKKKKDKFSPGMSVLCNGRKPWRHPFTGIIQFVRNNSVVVLIRSTHEEDDHLIVELNGKTVVEKKKVSIF